MFTNHIYQKYMSKPDLALNNLQWLICHKIPNQFQILDETFYISQRTNAIRRYESNYSSSSYE